jgi:hypothetical protein
LERQKGKTKNQRYDALTKESGFDLSSGFTQLSVQREVFERDLIEDDGNAKNQNPEFKITLKLYNGNYIDKWILLDFNISSKNLKINGTESQS